MPMEYTHYVGVRFKSVGKIYYFSTNLEISALEHVVVETVRGLELGEAVSEPKPMEELNLEAELKPIVRLATEEDLSNAAKNHEKAEAALETCKGIVKKHGLDMHLVHCEYTLDSTKVIFMYVSDDRVDFRELLKELASVFKCRIELRQIGPRDKSKIVGGLGTCGLPLCCSTFLGEFDGVSINMAKNQMLAINIDKISGACGRLMCCLKYEDEIYTKEKKRFPKVGHKVSFNNKTYKVTGINVLNDQVKLEDNGELVCVDVNELHWNKESKGKNNGAKE